MFFGACRAEPDTTLKANGKTRGCLHTTQESMLAVLTLELEALLMKNSSKKVEAKSIVHGK